MDDCVEYNDRPKLCPSTQAYGIWYSGAMPTTPGSTTTGTWYWDSDSENTETASVSVTVYNCGRYVSGGGKY